MRTLTLCSGCVEKLGQGGMAVHQIKAPSPLVKKQTCAECRGKHHCGEYEVSRR